MKYPNIKLCVFDIDGTLKRKKQKINKSIINTIQTLQKENIYCTVATGRGFGTAIHDTQGIKFNAPLIILDGSCIVDYQKINYFFLPLKDIEIERAENFVYRYHLEIESVGFWDPKHTKGYLYALPKYLSKLKKKYPDLRTKQHSSFETILRLAHKKKPSLISVKTLSKKKPPLKSTVVHDNGNLHFVNPHVSKKNAITKLCQQLSIKSKEVAVFGHDEDDLPIFDNKFGLKIAMRHATSQVIKKADIVLDKIEDIL